MSEERERSVALAKIAVSGAEAEIDMAIRQVRDAYGKTIDDTYKIITDSRPFLQESNHGDVLIMNLPFEDFVGDVGDFEFFPIKEAREILSSAVDLAVTHKDGVIVVGTKRTSNPHRGPAMVYIDFNEKRARIAGTNPEIQDTKPLSSGDGLKDARAALEIAEWVRLEVEDQAVRFSITSPRV